VNALARAPLGVFLFRLGVMVVTALQSMLRESLLDVGRIVRSLNTESEMRKAENTSEPRALTQDELTSVAGGLILIDVVNRAAIYLGDVVAKAARVATLPAPGNGDCGPNHNGV